jgi:foldase protein PrsA
MSEKLEEKKVEVKDIPAKETVVSNKKAKSNKNSANMLIYGFIFAVIVLFGGVLFVSKSAIQKGTTNSFFTSVAENFGFSAASIGGDTLSYKQLQNHKHAVKLFMENNPDAYGELAEKELTQMVMSRQLINILFASIANDIDVEISDEEIEKAKEKLLGEFGGDLEVANTELIKNYGWNFDQYFEEIVVPVLLEEKVGESFSYGDAEVDEKYNVNDVAVRARHILFQVTEGDDEEIVKKFAGEILQKIKDGVSFEDLAVEHGSDGTKDNGGDLGWFQRGMMVPEFEDAVFGVEAGQLLPELVKTDFGYHIIRVDEKTSSINNFKEFMDDTILDVEVKVFVDVVDPFVAIKESIEAAKNKVQAPPVQIEGLEGADVEIEVVE